MCHLFLDHAFLLAVKNWVGLASGRTVVDDFSFDSRMRLRRRFDVAQTLDQQFEDFPVSEVQLKNRLKFVQVTIHQNTAVDCVLAQNRCQLFNCGLQLLNLRQQIDKVIATQL